MAPDDERTVVETRRPTRTVASMDAGPGACAAAIVWVVDDDPDVAAHLEILLRRADVAATVRAFADGAALRAALAERAGHPDLVLIDQILPEDRGSALAEEVAAVYPGAVLRLITAAPDEVAPQERELGVIAKPVRVADIADLLPRSHR